MGQEEGEGQERRAQADEEGERHAQAEEQIVRVGEEDDRRGQQSETEQCLADVVAEKVLAIRRFVLAKRDFQVPQSPVPRPTQCLEHAPSHLHARPRCRRSQQLPAT